MGFDTTAATAVGLEEAEPDNDTQASLRRLRTAVTELSKAVRESLHDQRGNAAECLRRAEAMLDEARDKATPAAVMTARPGLAPWQIRKVLTYIDANLDTSIMNRDLAAIAGLSVFHFNVTFRNSVGESPHEYLIRRRVERAQGLMLSTQKSLSEIAAECGMADQAHLTRLFRRIAGESPAAWRRARSDPPMTGGLGQRATRDRHFARPSAP